MIGDALAGEAPRAVAVAVSGGGDSTALLLLAADWARAASVPLSAVTVDHGLRPEAGAEAAAVADLAARIGVPHRTLHWDAAREPDGNLQDRARRARRRLIGAWAREVGVGHVLMGHTADDVAETFLMRLARSAGVDGLAAMRPRWSEEGVVWSRPLLAARRDDLRRFLRDRGEDWAEDPSNADPTYDRARARQALAALAPLGIGVDNLSAVARNLADARVALDAAAASFARAEFACEAGELRFDRDALLGEPTELQRRLLTHAIAFLAGPGYPPRAEGLARLREAIRDFGGMTLAGCRLRTEPDGTCRLGREPAALAGVAALPGEAWDGRIVVTGPDPEAEVAVLGETGLKALGERRRRDLPRATLAATPGVFREAHLVAAPLAGWPQGWSAAPAEGRADLASFILAD